MTAKKRTPNPDWTRDELIMALALYFRSGRKQLDPSHPDVVALSSVLNSLGVHDGQARNQTFRNPNGVAMKLGNYSAIDPQRAGAGLSGGNRLERVIWEEFAAEPPRLYATAEALRSLALPSKVTEPIRGWDPDSEEEEFAEGKLLTRLHLARERNPKAVKRKKQQVLAESGHLMCECCDFDFEEVYGELGRAFAECHHRVPLATLTKVKTIRMQDLAIVCANCHRMLHRRMQGHSAGVLPMEELRALILANRAR